MSTTQLATAAAAGVAAGLALGRVMSTMRARTIRLPTYTLHLYDHCPFCIRVELLLGWKGIPYTRKVYGYGDTLGDEKGLYYGGTTLTGKKQLPCLTIERSGDPAPVQLPESGDIAAYLEDATGPGGVLLPPLSGRRDLKAFFDTKGEFKTVGRRLTRPRMQRMTMIKDWEREEDRIYARAKYESQGFDYEDAIAHDAENQAAMATLLAELDGMIKGKCSLNDGACGLTWDDLVYLPELRTLTMVRGLEWPLRLRAYVEGACEKANVETYFSRSL